MPCVRQSYPQRAQMGTGFSFTWTAIIVCQSVAVTGIFCQAEAKVSRFAPETSVSKLRRTDPELTPAAGDGPCDVMVRDRDLHGRRQRDAAKASRPGGTLQWTTTCCKRDVHGTHGTLLAETAAGAAFCVRPRDGSNPFWCPQQGRGPKPPDQCTSTSTAFQALLRSMQHKTVPLCPRGHLPYCPAGVGLS